MPFEDKTLTCVECGQEFIFSASDQEFHLSRGYQEPKRCPNCRQNRRASRGGSTGGFGRERTMYDAVCANCGTPTQVPFLPRQDRPVYCTDCYNKTRQQAPRTRRW